MQLSAKTIFLFCCRKRAAKAWAAVDSERVQFHRVLTGLIVQPKAVRKGEAGAFLASRPFAGLFEHPERFRFKRPSY